MPRHPTLSNEQIAAVEEACGIGSGGRGVGDTGPALVAETHASEDRVMQEMLEREAWKDRVCGAIHQRGIQTAPYWFLVFAEHQLRILGIGLAEQRAVDVALDEIMPRGPMNDERPWYEMVHA